MYKRIINQTFLPVFENKMVLTKALCIATLLIIILTKLPQFYETKGVLILTNILVVLVNISIAITTHRVLLLGQENIPTWGSFTFGRREWEFLKASILMGFIMIPIALIALIPYGIFVVVPLFFIIFSRLSLVYPTIAIDKKIGFSEAWEYTKNYKLLTFFTIIIFPTIFALILSAVYMLVIGFLIKLISPHLDILFSVLNVFITVFVISALSATYKVIKEEHPEYFEPLQIDTDHVVIHNNKQQHRVNTNEYEINFDSLKQSLIEQYEQLGFTKTVVDKHDSWMIKNPEELNAYVALSQKAQEYKIETYNVQDANLEQFLFKKDDVQ